MYCVDLIYLKNDKQIIPPSPMHACLSNMSTMNIRVYILCMYIVLLYILSSKDLVM